VILIINILTIIQHYVDKFLYFHNYPQSLWVNAKDIDAFWLIMTPFTMPGSVLDNKGVRLYFHLCLYSLMSLLVVGHYRPGALSEMSFKFNFLMLLEAVAALTLIAYTVWLQLCFNNRLTAKDKGHEGLEQNDSPMVNFVPFAVKR